MKTKLTVNPKFLVPVTLTFAIILITVTALDIIFSYNDIYKSKTEEAVSLLSAVQKSGENAYLSSIEVENLITEKLINNAYLISRMEENISIDAKTLNAISEANNIDHIYLFSSLQKPELKNSNQVYSELGIYEKFSSEIDSIYSGKYDYYITGSIPDDNGSLHLLVLHKRPSKLRGLIALSVETDYLLAFRREIGVGTLFQKIADGKDIEYIVIQDSTGIITASKGIENLSSFYSDKFLGNTITDKKIAAREIVSNGKKIFEAVKPFITGDEIQGVIRIGISLDPVNSLMNRTILRSIAISLLLLLVGAVVIVYITSSQSYSLLKNEFRKVKSYTEKVLESMSDAVVVTDNTGTINLFNKSAERIFGLSSDKVIGKSCSYIMKEKESLIDLTIRTGTPVEYSEYRITTQSGKQLIAGGSTSIIYNSKGEAEAVIAVIRDITEQKNFEEIKKRQEKLSAMGELAGGVAHEIKNPLNLIGITAQRLEKEFIPSEGSGEYLEHIKAMKQEVQRVSNIINQFLKFARPPKINKRKTNIKEFMENLYISFNANATKGNINFSYKCDDFEAYIDPEQMRQVMINLIQNAFDAVSNGGTVCFEVYKESSNLIIKVADNGSGISEEHLSKIFNIYFTTKTNGTGLGLSIVNQIVTEHGGVVKVNSNKQTGTIFTVEMPL